MTKQYGNHWIAHYVLCEGKNSSSKLIIDNPAELEKILVEELEGIGAGILGTIPHKFEPQGATVLVGISESHASVHTWPEDYFAEFDFNTCNLQMDGQGLVDRFGKRIGARGYISQLVRRYDYRFVNEKEVRRGITDEEKIEEYLNKLKGGEK